MEIMKKGAIEVLNVIFLTGLLLGVVTTVFFWSEPIIRENEDMSVLQNSEIFVNSLARGIKNIVNRPGRTFLTIPSSPSPQTNIFLEFDATSEKLSLEVAGTAGTIYSTGGLIPLGKNSCTPEEGIANQDEPQTICVRSEKVGKTYATTYTLKFIQLNTEGIESNKIDLVGVSNSGGSGHLILLENVGSKTELVDGKEVQKIKIYVEII